MKIKLNNTDKFRFKKEGHIHEQLIDGKWTTVPGASSIAGMFDDKGWFGYWAAGLALEPFGWLKLKQDRSNIDEVLQAAKKGMEFIIEQSKVDVLVYDNWRKFLDKCYRAHAKETKDTAESGTILHKFLENYLKIKLGDVTANLDPMEDKFATQINKFFAWEKENNVEWLGSEIHVGSLMFQYCGIADFVAKINGRIVLGDFKTSKQWKDSWIPQLVGLKQCFQEMGQPIDDLTVVRLSRDG